VVFSYFSHGHALHRGLLLGSSGSLDRQGAGILGSPHSLTLVASKALGEKTKWSDFVRILEPEWCSASRRAASAREWAFGFRWIVPVGTMAR
jgi:hypothetical protein